MSTIKDRILVFIRHLNIGQNKFEKSCGLSCGTISSVKQAPNGSTILKIIDTYPDLSLEWLMRGEGEMLKSTSLETPQLVVEDELVEDEPTRIALEDDGLTVGERLDQFIQFKGLGRYQFEMKCGLSQGYIANIRNSPHPDKLKKIANVFPELNIEWLMIGRGEMLHRKESGMEKLFEVHQKLVEARFEKEQAKRIALESRFEEIMGLLKKLTKK